MKFFKLFSNRRAVGALRFGLAVLLLAGLFAGGFIDAGSVAQVLQTPGSFAVAVLCLFVSTLIAAERWRILLNVHGRHFQRLPLFAVNGFANFAAIMLPGAAAEALRVSWVIRNRDSNRTGTALSVLVDKLIALYGLLSLGAICLLIRPELIAGRPPLRIMAIILTLAMVGLPLGLVTLVAVERRFHILKRFASWGAGAGIASFAYKLLTATVLYGRSAKSILRALGLSLLCAGLMTAAIVALVPVETHSSLEASDFIVALAVGMAANVLPLTPGGLGVGEVGFALVCTLLEGGGGSSNYALLFLSFRLAGIASLLPYVLVPLYMPFGQKKAAPNAAISGLELREAT
jgi:uncharacterized membrane protein YbhN (UPF0104 family)